MQISYNIDRSHISIVAVGQSIYFARIQMISICRFKTLSAAKYYASCATICVASTTATRQLIEKPINSTK